MLMRALFVVLSFLLLAGCSQVASQPGQSPTSGPGDWKSLYTITLVVTSVTTPVSSCVSLQGGPIRWSVLVDGQSDTWPLLYGDGPEFPLGQADVSKCIRFSGKQYRLQKMAVGHCGSQPTNEFVFCFNH